MWAAIHCRTRSRTALKRWWKETRCLTGASAPNRCRPSVRRSTRPAQPPRPTPPRLGRHKPRPPQRAPKAHRATPPIRRGVEGQALDILGSFALLLALIVAAYAFFAGIAGIFTRRSLLKKSAP